MKFNNRKVRYVEDYATACIHFLAPQANCREAIDLMARHRIRHLPVVTNGKIVGVISQRDLNLLTQLKDSEEYTVGDLMTPLPYIVQNYEKLENVVHEMNQRGVGCAIVQNALGELTGIFTSTDAVIC